MLKKLEDVLNIENMGELSSETENDPNETEKESHTNIINTDETKQMIDQAEELDNILSNITGLDQHDVEMDDIVSKAMTTYEELVHLGRNSPVMYSCKVYEVAGNLLKTAMDARDSKLSKKMKLIDMKLKKLKIDTDANKKNNDESDDDGSTLTRNDILELMNEDDDLTSLPKPSDVSQDK